MGLFVGTSGWAYPEWKPDFYPKGTPASRFLEHYGRAFGACEVNATFYRAQSEATLRRWVTATPSTFRFCVKTHRSLTYSKWFVPDENGVVFWKEFVTHLTPLQPRLVALLAQFPAHKQRDDRALDALLDALPEGPTYAFEFRAPSWSAARVASALAERGACTVVSDRNGEVPSNLPLGPIAYVRLRGDRYTERTRAAWWALLRREGEVRDVYVFTKHRQSAPTDPLGGVGLARWLQGRAQLPSSPT